MEGLAAAAAAVEDVEWRVTELTESHSQALRWGLSEGGRELYEGIVYFIVSKRY